MLHRALLALMLVAGCSKKSPEAPPEAPPPSPPADPAPPASGDAPGSAVAVLHKALSVKDPEPACADVEALVDEPVAALVELAEANAMPPWAGMRAARCVITGHSVEAADRLLAWSTSVELKGLGLLVFDHVDQLPETLAVQVATDALAGPLVDDARERLAGSSHAPVQKLLDSMGDTP